MKTHIPTVSLTIFHSQNLSLFHSYIVFHSSDLTLFNQTFIDSYSLIIYNYLHTLKLLLCTITFIHFKSSLSLILVIILRCPIKYFIENNIMWLCCDLKLNWYSIINPRTSRYACHHDAMGSTIAEQGTATPREI